MITITVADAIERLRAVDVPFKVLDQGIGIISIKYGINEASKTIIPWQDTLGSLVSRDAISAEVIYWQNRKQK